MKMREMLQQINSSEALLLDVDIKVTLPNMTSIDIDECEFKDDVFVLKAKLKEFRLYWVDGSKDIIRGTSISDAFNKKHGKDALAALDYYEEIK
tara:strand:+ start:461 stop:742 length:282 start_codon:yes stop_codon:yes gene_type:complete